MLCSDRLGIYGAAAEPWDGPARRGEEAMVNSLSTSRNRAGRSSRGVFYGLSPCGHLLCRLSPLVRSTALELVSPQRLYSPLEFRLFGGRMHEVVVTGLGLVSVLGTGAEKAQASLEAGRSGIRVVPERKELGFRSPLSGVISDFHAPKLDRKQLKTMAEYTVHAYAAALEACAMAGWGAAELQSPRTGLILGNDSSTLACHRQMAETLKESSTLPLGSGLVFQALTSTTTMNLNVLLGTQGASWTVAGACASGAHSVGQALDLIALGRQDRVLCGGVQELNWGAVSSFDATNAFSTRIQDPEAASRPFDAERDGLVPSGGAAVLALERGDLARKRGATILGRLLAYAFSSDGRALAVPSGEGMERCMKECLERGGRNTDAVRYVSAHATSTPVGDRAEAGAISRVFGESRPWVSSLKSMTGHEMWMAGAAQAAYTLLMMRGGFIAPNKNFVRQEEGAASLNLVRETLPERPTLALLNSAGFGGTNACLLLEALP